MCWKRGRLRKGWRNYDETSNIEYRTPNVEAHDARRSIFDVQFARRMKIPPFVMGMTLLFWGWQADFFLPGALMGLILESSRVVKVRWELSDDDFKRIWTFCALLFLTAAIYAFADSGGPEGFGHLLSGPSVATERDAGSASARTAAALIRWLPMIFFLFVFAQAFSSRQEIPLHTISLILQRRWKQAKKQGKAPPTAKGVDVAYPYFAVCLFAASVHRNQNNSFFWGLCVLLGWVLWVQRPRRFGVLMWSVALAMAIVFGFFGAQSIGYFQRYVENFNVQMVARLLGKSRTDATKSQTQIGEIGRVETSPRILIRLHPKSGEFPAYLREASYRGYRSGTWSANRATSDFTPVPAAPTNENSFWLGLIKTNESRIGISCYLQDWNRQNRNSEGLLPLPTGTARLENLLIYQLQKNGLGTVMAEGPGLVQFDALYGPGATMDGPPETNVMAFAFTNFESRVRPGIFGNTNGLPSGFSGNGRFGTNRGLGFLRGNNSRARGTDLQIPTNEIPALDEIVSELNLKDQSYEDTLKTIQEFFSTKFTYRLWQDADNDENTNSTPVSRFLLKTRAGHCEYFATATVLLLRNLNIPARYAVGYSVHESGWNGYVVRQSDAHAWCLVWNEQKSIWEDFDTTPGTGLESQHGRASIFFSDVWWWLRFQFSKLRWGQTPLRNYILIGLVPVMALLLFQIVRTRRRRKNKAGATRRAVAWPGLDSEFYQIEKQLAERGVIRGPNETLADWLERAAADPSLVALKNPLRELLRLHYRYRFDPQGLNDADRDELRREARECLDKMSQLPQPAGA
jgi:hypothetical protein